MGELMRGRRRDEILERLCARRADRIGTCGFVFTQVYLLGCIYMRLLATPRIRLRLEEQKEAAPIRQWLDRKSFGIRTPLHEAASVLRIKRTGDPLAGSRFATLRRMERKAAKLGVVCREVPEDERDSLLQRAIAFEMDNPDPRYRRDNPNTEGLELARLWLVAVDASGTPLVLSVTPVSGNTALLRYMRTLSVGPETTLARYALTASLLRTLNRKHVRYLVDNVSPLSVPTALRHFATMVGFRIARIRLTA